MLMELSIRDFALISELELEFSPGFNVLTGETGAGKSIIIDALSVVLGARASAEMIRTGAGSARIEARFDAPPSSQQLLDGWGVPVADELVLSRTIASNGRSTCRINGTMAAVNQLASLAPLLVEIMSQHENQGLRNPSSHLELLDNFAGADVLALRQQVSALYRDHMAVKKQLEQLQKGERQRIQRMDTLQQQIEEIVAAAIVADDEDDQLLLEHARLANAEELHHVVWSVHDMLRHGSEERSGLAEQLAYCVKDLQRALEHDQDLSSCCQLLEAAVVEVEEACRELSQRGEHYHADPARIQVVEDRIRLLDGLKRKYGPTLAAVSTHFQEAKHEYTSLQGSASDVDRLEEQVGDLAQRWQNAAQALSDQRHAAAQRLKVALERELADLNMAKTSFDVAFEDVPQMTENGKEQVEFMITANVGEQLKPLNMVASGGELSRIMLALKLAATGASGGATTLVFDEIDSGLGGETGAMLGRKLRQLQATHQLLCITHLPTVASCAQMHVAIHKAVVDGRTVVNLSVLDDDEERLRELVRMLGGSSADQAGYEHARELLRKA